MDRKKVVEISEFTKLLIISTSTTPFNRKFLEGLWDHPIFSNDANSVTEEHSISIFLGVLGF